MTGVCLQLQNQYAEAIKQIIVILKKTYYSDMYQYTLSV